MDGSGGGSDGTPQIARLLGACEDSGGRIDGGTVAASKITVLYCTVLLCFRSPAAPQALLDLTCVGCCTEYSKRTAWLDTYLAPVRPSSGPPPARASSSAGPVESRASVRA
jgi:hypothetical protein